MAELSQQERLQPSLLDRLTDNERDKKQETRNRRVLSIQKLRECVLRDLAWLLNTGDLNSAEDLDDYPFVKQSVLNYGMVDLTGFTVSTLDIASVEKILRQAILDFEPRILRKTVKVRVLVADDQMNRNAVQFDIEGELWAQPVPIRLYLKTEVDLEDGSVSVVEQSGGGG